MKNLIERLRLIGGVCDDAADLLAQQAAEIAELKESVSDLRAASTILKEERDALQAKLDTAIQSSAHWQHQCTELQAKLSAMESVDPVAWIEWDMNLGEGDPDSITAGCNKPELACDGWEWIPLYTAPKVAQPSKPTFAEWCATNWDGPPSANARDAYNRIIGGQQP